MGCGQSKKIEFPEEKLEKTPRKMAPEEIKDAVDLNYMELAQLQEITFGKSDAEKCQNFLISASDAQNIQFKLLYASKEQLEQFPPIICPGNMLTYLYLNFGSNEHVDGAILNKYLVSLGNCRQLFGFKISLSGQKVNNFCCNVLQRFFTSNALLKVISIELSDCKITDSGMSQLLECLKQQRFVEVFKLKLTNCEKITEKSWTKLQEVLDKFSNMKIYQIQHDKFKQEFKPERGNWIFDKRAQHFAVKKVKVKQNGMTKS